MYSLHSHPPKRSYLFKKGVGRRESKEVKAKGPSNLKKEKIGRRWRRIIFLSLSFLFLLAVSGVVVYSGTTREQIITELLTEKIANLTIGAVNTTKDMTTSTTTYFTTEPRPLSILMLNVIKGTDTRKYRTALASQECYAKRHGYQFLVANSEDFPECQQKDFMFKRHCVVVQLLPIADYIIFLDADMAVVNFDKKWEEYINPKFDIVFYERFFNWEFAAGSYIARSSNWTVEFLTRFANYETKLPHSFHGTDNGALHIFLAEEMYPDLDDDLEICRKIYQRSRGYATLFQYEACVRSIMGSRRFSQHIRIFKKGTGWVRDIWLTDSRWNPERDFLLHALQEQKSRRYAKLNPERPNLGGGKAFLYYNPFKSLPIPKLCASKGYRIELDRRLIIPLEQINGMLQKIERHVEKKRYESLAKVKGYLKK